MREASRNGDSNEGNSLVLEETSHLVEMRSDLARPLLLAVRDLHTGNLMFVLEEFVQSLPSGDIL